MRSTELAEEAVQDLFLELLRIRDRLEPDKAHRYMWKAAYFRAKHFPQAQKEYKDEVKHDMPSTRSVESVVIDRMVADDALSVLSEKEKDIVESVVIDGNGIAETARMNGVPRHRIEYYWDSAVRKLTAAAA